MWLDAGMLSTNFRRSPDLGETTLYINQPLIFIHATGDRQEAIAQPFADPSSASAWFRLVPPQLAQAGFASYEKLLVWIERSLPPL